MPSSDQMASDSRPKRSRMRAESASAHAACTRPPYGDSTQSRQSPISSRKRSTTIVRSDGTTRVISRCSRRNETKLRAARSSRSYSAASSSGSRSTAQRENSPIALPSSAGRPTPSPFQNGTAPGTPGAGVTITRSRVISSIRQLDAPSRNVCPGRASYTISSSSSPTRRPSGRCTPNSPRSGIVPALVTASWSEPFRARTVSSTRSQTIRGRSSPNSSDG